jgi:hypothetical protein
MRGISRGSTRRAGEVSPLLPRPHFPHMTSQDRPWGKQNTSARAPAKTQQNPGGHTTSGLPSPIPAAPVDYEEQLLSELPYPRPRL